MREDAGDVEQVIAACRNWCSLIPKTLNAPCAEMRRSPPFLPVTLADRISWEDISRVAVNAPALPGITPEVGLTRVYPRRADFAHVVGYVGPVSDYDLSQIEDPDQLLRIPRFRSARSGVEAKREDLLRGKAGAKQVEVNATGRVMRELEPPRGPARRRPATVPSMPKLQGYVQARLGKESASAVVIDCETGDLRRHCLGAHL